MAFVKLDCGILDSTLWVESLEIRITFITMLAMAGPDGLVEATAPGIARRANLPLEQVRSSIHKLESPDEDSRSLAEDGRRIVRIDGGYRIVNYLAYRERDLTAAERMRRFRDKQKSQENQSGNKNVTRNDITVTRNVTEVEVEAEEEVEEEVEVEAKATPIINKTPTASAKPADTAAVERKRRTDEPLPTHATWSTYAYAYGARYAVQPVRNAKINAQIVQLVKRLGADEAPAVAAFYVRHNNALYVRANHCVDLLLRDCEGLHTQWANGRTVTDTEARQVDRKQNNLGIAERLIAKEREKRE